MKFAFSNVRLATGSASHPLRTEEHIPSFGAVQHLKSRKVGTLSPRGSALGRMSLLQCRPVPKAGHPGRAMSHTSEKLLPLLPVHTAEREVLAPGLSRVRASPSSPVKTEGKEWRRRLGREGIVVKVGIPKGRAHLSSAAQGSIICAGHTGSPRRVRDCGALGMGWVQQQN